MREITKNNLVYLSLLGNVGDYKPIVKEMPKNWKERKIQKFGIGQEVTIVTDVLEYIT